jgi:hypothetical protein
VALLRFACIGAAKRFHSHPIAIWRKMASTDVRAGSGEAVVDIAAWLQRLGFEQYEQAFRANDIDGEVLPELTAEDLVGLGVTSIGLGKSPSIIDRRSPGPWPSATSSLSPPDRTRAF